MIPVSSDTYTLPALNWELVSGVDEVLAWGHVNYKTVLQATVKVELAVALDVGLELGGPTYQANETIVHSIIICISSA
ncbi:hypothetical protein Ocin01_07439 [Orchesella cincta]|uniref:Uncharacterized protein n=1 Tax=Orchesella cincta TaxID=48709 RepID=A0A1D2N1U2_ORCCI|nr:hypothetical protein Ocin01_07439 [Orchesella cincta]